ncbi:MAG: RNA polymerase sigma factor [Proteobacteria bacterium]|nr:RNA polymerase sigma factor [Pseudomonadota bacterium]
MSNDSNKDSSIDFQERNWLKQHLSGDKQAFGKLMQAYRKPVYSYLVRNGLDKNTRDDLFQDIFFKIHKAANSYKRSNRLSPWIFTIAVNTVRNYLRDQKQKPTHNHLSLCIDETPESQLVDESPTPDKIIQSKHLIQWLQKAMSDLPPIQCEALNLTIIEGLKLSEAAKILDVPLSTIKTYVRRARQSLIQSYKTNDSQVSKRSIS